MVRFILQQIKITGNKCFGKWFAKNVVEETVDLDALSEHMSNHNSPYSKGVIKGLLTDMIGCIKELLLEGKNVKIDDLAIFSLGIKNKAMADKEEDFSVSKNIDGVKLKARATGELMSKSLNLEATLKKVYARFPRLEERKNQLAGTLSGGEQQMLAIGRALMSRPKILMLDEPSLGLAPLVVQMIFDLIREINKKGVTILLVEQNANMALKTADIAYVLETGEIVLQGSGKELLENPTVREAYLGKKK